MQQRERDSGNASEYARLWVRVGDGFINKKKKGTKQPKQKAKKAKPIV
jgi:hypothetical protein